MSLTTVHLLLDSLGLPLDEIQKVPDRLLEEIVTTYGCEEIKTYTGKEDLVAPDGRIFLVKAAINGDFPGITKDSMVAAIDSYNVTRQKYEVWIASKNKTIQKATRLIGRDDLATMDLGLWRDTESMGILCIDYGARIYYTEVCNRHYIKIQLGDIKDGRKPQVVLWEISERPSHRMFNKLAMIGVVSLDGRPK